MPSRRAVLGFLGAALPSDPTIRWSRAARTESVSNTLVVGRERVYAGGARVVAPVAGELFAVRRDGGVPKVA